MTQMYRIRRRREKAPLAERPKPKLHYENNKYVLWNADICPIAEIL